MHHDCLRAATTRAATRGNAAPSRPHQSRRSSGKRAWRPVRARVRGRGRKREGSARSSGFAPRTAAQARVDDAAQQTSAGRLHRGCDSANNKPQQHGTARIIAGPGGPVAAEIIRTATAGPSRRRCRSASASPGTGPQRPSGQAFGPSPAAPAAERFGSARARAQRDRARTVFFKGAALAPQHTRNSRSTAHPAQIRAPAAAPRRGSGPAGRRPRPRIARARHGGTAAASRTVRPAPPLPAAASQPGRSPQPPVRRRPRGAPPPVLPGPAARPPASNAPRKAAKPTRTEPCCP